MITTPNIVFEDKHLIAIHKPAGMAVEVAARETSVRTMLKAYLTREHKKHFIGFAHRLDKPVSGLLLVAKKPSVLKALNEQFESRSVVKKYVAMVQGTPAQSEATLKHYLTKNDTEQKAYLWHHKTPGAKEVSLHYRVLQSSNNQSLLEVELHTGRYHQIRAQLAQMGHPIVGDEKYGATLPAPAGTILLHAHSLSFTHPVTGEQMTLVAERGF